ncbi:hypothetical protein BJX65DRAFT_291213 [Aspergillus insuetus]
MQLKYLLLALTAQTTLAATLETFILDDGTTIEADPSTVIAAHSPDERDTTRGVGSSPAGAKMLLARACSNPNYPVGCQNGNICCQYDDLCCENRSCIDPDYHNCCLYGYYCDKPYRCVRYQNGNIGCRA